MKERYVGIDPSLRCTGLVVLDEHGEILHHATYGYALTRKATDQDKMLRFWNVADWVDMEVARWSVETAFLAVEGYAFSKHSSSVTELASLRGSITAILYERRRIIPMVIPPSEARKLALGANVPKRDVAKHLGTIADMLDRQPDKMDAYVLARATMLKVRPPLQLF